MSFINIDEMAENEASYDSLMYENPLLTELTETCSNLDNSPEMKAFLNILLNTYKKTDKKFRESQEFERALRRAITLVKNDSCHKFSYIGDLCDILRSGNIKEVEQVNTTSNISKDNEISHTSICEAGTNSQIPETEVVDLDSTKNDIIIDLDRNDCNMMDEKENDTFNDNNSSDDNNLLVPYKIMQVRERSPIDDDIDNDIEKLEQKIEKYQNIIAQLEEKDVSDDDVNSPYIQSEKYKARIVTLYEELCKLTGEEAVKRSTVHLKVPEGHPSGPVRRLEAFLNKNINSDGQPTFPDFRDVVKCVIKANEEDELGWSKQKIAKEAMVLFTHCGLALQQRRQRREWRHLFSKVKGERDPADSHRALLVRLERNRRAAARKEAEVLERFAVMQNAPSQKAVVSNKEAKLNTNESSNESEIEYMSTSSSSDEETNVNLPSQIATSSSSSNDNTSQVNSEVTAVKLKKEYNLGQLLEELEDNFIPSRINIKDSDLHNIIMEISDSSDNDSV